MAVLVLHRAVVFENISGPLILLARLPSWIYTMERFTLVCLLWYDRFSKVVRQSMVEVVTPVDLWDAVARSWYASFTSISSQRVAVLLGSPLHN